MEGIEGASCLRLTDFLSASQVCLSGGREGEEATEGDCQTGQVFGQESSHSTRLGSQKCVVYWYSCYMSETFTELLSLGADRCHTFSCFEGNT